MRSPDKIAAEERERECVAEIERLRAAAPHIFPYRARGPVYRWKVTHHDHRPAEVVGATRYEAVIAAAKAWRVPWTSVARACIFEKLGEVAEE